MNSSPPFLLLPLTVVLAVVAGLLWYTGYDVDSGFGSGSLLKVAILLGLVWVAWPAFSRPAKWLPPGIVAVVIVAIGACAVQPKLAFALVPMVGGLITFAGVVRFFRGK
jgi:hypothetical protein